MNEEQTEDFPQTNRPEPNIVEIAEESEVSNTDTDRNDPFDENESSADEVDIWDANGNRKCNIYCPHIINKEDVLEAGPHICPICPTVVLPCEHLLKEHMRLVHNWFKSKRTFFNQ